MTRTWSFDSPETQAYSRVRQAVIERLLGEARKQMELASALDVGCGIGYFSKFLSDLGFRVVAVDGRDENASEGRRRFPDITFLTANAEDLSVTQMGVFDLVLCVGLLYHLENPFRAIRNLHALTGKILLVESMCAPGSNSTLELLDEYHADNQSLDYVAFYPTEACLVKMLRRAGFPFVYGLAKLPDNVLFRKTLRHEKRRTILLAAKVSLETNLVCLLREPSRPWDIWITRYERLRNRARSLAKLRIARMPSVHETRGKP